MVTVLVTSFLLLAAISYAIYCWQRTSSNVNAERALPPPPRARSLFSDESSAAELDARLRADEALKQAHVERASLLERAAGEDKTALLDAHASGDATLYEEVLDALVVRANGYKKVLALASYISRHELRVNAPLADKFLEAWKASTVDRRSLAVMLHLAAMADDAHVYQRAVEAAFQLWREGALADVSAEELRALFDGEFWMLSGNVRSSGAGFILKRKLAALRRELSSGSSQSSSGEATVSP
jgi:hypothetical protein